VATGGGAPTWAPLVAPVERVIPGMTLDGVRWVLATAPADA
jgi:hypothetical protein